MIEQIKQNYVNICIAFVYTILAMLVYGIWSYSAWQLWWATLLIVLAIFGVGFAISFLWIRSEIREKQKKDNPKEEKVA